MLNAGTVQATADLNMRRFSQGMKQMHKEGAVTSRRVQGSLDGIGSKLRSVAFLAQTAFASGLVMGARRAIREFALLEGAMAKFEVVFGDQSGEMEAWVNTIRRRLPLANREIIAAAASMQDLLVPMGIAREQATGMTQEWLELAGALAAFNDVPVDQALEAIRSAIAGQSRPLRAFGIDVRETAIQQIALESGLIKAGEAMDEQVRQQALLRQAYKQSQDAIDGYQFQLGSTLIMEQELGASFKDTLAIIGQQLQPAYNGLISTLAELFTVINTGMNRATRRQDIFNQNMQAVFDLLEKDVSDMGLSELQRALGFVGAEIEALEDRFEDISKFPEQEEALKRLTSMWMTLAVTLDEVSRRDRISLVDQNQINDEAESLERARRALGLIREELAILKPVDDIIDLDGDLFNKITLHMNDFGTSFDEAMAAVRAAPPSFDDLQDAVWNVSLSTEELAHRMEIVKETLAEGSGAGMYFSRTLADGLDQVLFQARSVEDAIKGIIRQLASRAFLTGIMALFSGGSSLGGQSFGRAMFGGTFHTGGIVPGVGEKMINVQGGEAVLSRSQIGEMQGGNVQSVQVTVNVRGGFEDRNNVLKSVIDEQVRQTVRLR